MASQLYPEWFKLDSDKTLPVAQQQMPADMPGKTLHETEPGKTEEAPAGAENPLLSEDTSQTTPAITAAEGDETVAEQPETQPAKAPPSEGDEVTRLLAAAEADLKARRLTSPAGNNAWDRYQQVLALQPTNQDAIKGMEQVIESYMELFGIAVGQEDFDKADTYLERVRDLHPDSPVLEQGASRIVTAKQARADRLAKEKAIGDHLTSFETALRGITWTRQPISWSGSLPWTQMRRRWRTGNDGLPRPGGRRRTGRRRWSVSVRLRLTGTPACLRRQCRTDSCTRRRDTLRIFERWIRTPRHWQQQEQRLAEAEDSGARKGHWESQRRNEGDLDKATGLLSEMIGKLEPDARARPAVGEHCAWIDRRDGRMVSSDDFLPVKS